MMSRQLLLYIFKRILVMLPTLAIIAVICFLVLNLAPGRPGQQANAQQSAGSEESRAQQRIFKEFFNYDRPIFLNDYHSVTTDEVEEMLDLMSGGRDGTNKDRVDTQYKLEDYGEYIVPQLMATLENAKTPAIEAQTIKQLSINAQLRNLFLGREDEIPDSVKDQQRRIGEHNQQVNRWKMVPGTLTAEEQAFLLTLTALGVTSSAQLPIASVPILGMADAAAASGGQTRTFERYILRSLWRDWYVTNEARFDLSSSVKAEHFFFDTRFAKYMGNLIRGDFGFTRKKEPVWPEIRKRLKFTIVIGIVSIFLTYFLSIPIGIFSAVKQHTVADQVMTLGLFVLYSLPSFFVGTLMVQYIPSGEPFFTSGFETGTLDNPYLTSGERIWDTILHITLPVICTTYGSLAALSRYARTGLLDVIRADYIRTARAKGLSEPIVILKHAMRNGMIPILTLLASLLPFLFGGSIVIESIFQIDGIGLYMLEAIQSKDYAVIMAVLLISAVLTLGGLLISDISYALVDPRISFD